MNNSLYLSVVIISRNEEKNIAGCIESVIEATKTINDSEIILADSASTDNTIEIAKKYPIKIVQLRASWRLSPAAGCYIGFLHSKGKYIQFIGGDMILDRDWFKRALPVLEKKKEVAGVSGICTQETYGRTKARELTEYSNLPVGEVTSFAGATLFKRHVLSEVGAFNPWLRAVEEGELCYRIVDKGYKLIQLPHHITHHLGRWEESYRSFVKKKIRYTIAQGQILRYSLNKKRIFAWRLKEYKFKLLGAFLIILGFLALAGAVLGYIIMVYVWITGIFAVFLWMLYETRKVKDAAKLLVTQTLKSPFFVWGFFEPKKDTDAYPTDVKVLK